MTATSTMCVEPRASVGKGESRALRLSGMIPGIVYGDGKENVNIAVDPRDVVKGMRSRSFYTRIFEFTINGKKERAMCKDVQLHPVTDAPLHIDFMRVGKDTRLNIGIPVTFVNELDSPGLKHGGMLNIVVPSLEVVCSADHIPDSLVIDLAGLEVGASIHLSDIQLPNGVVPLHPERDNTLATIVAPAGRKGEGGQGAE